MNTRVLIFMGAFAACAVHAQPRRAEITGGGGDRGKCTVEVVVDGSAEVEIRGDSAILRTLSGRPAEWRRFVCNGRMPPNPEDFRFAGVDGRGRQQLVRDPRNGGAAVVRIDDRDNGSEGYTFDVFWREGGFGPPPSVAPRVERRDEDAYHREREEYYRGDWRSRLFERVRDDLNHAARESFPRGDDRYRLDRTRQQLDELQSQMASGRFDRRELDDVIAALDRVVRDNRLAPRDRDILNDDLNRMREVRDRR